VTQPYTFISVPAGAVESYLLQKAREGYVLFTMFPCRKETTLQSVQREGKNVDQSVELTTSVYICMEYRGSATTQTVPAQDGIPTYTYPSGTVGAP
jgi:hypothetical protein